MLRVKINGKFEEIEKDIDAFHLLNSKNLDIKTVIFIVNEKIIKKEELKKYTVQQNDEIEILHFVSGG